VTSEEQTLAGISVVSLAVNIPGPVAVARLRDLGASVTKIEPLGGDALERAAPAWYAALHRDCAVVRLDLRSAVGRAHLAASLRDAALLMTASRPSALDRLGLGWDALHAQFPQLSHVAIVGEHAPQGERPGHDLTYVAQAQLLDPPHMPRTLLADLAGAERAVIAVLELLLRRANGGAAAYREVSLRAAAEAFALPYTHGLTHAGGRLGGGFGGYRMYRASDGWIAVAALESHFVERLHAELHLTPWDDAAAEAIFRTREALVWEAWAAERDLPLVALPAEHSAATTPAG
jgi:alpha-methylacyl-CoA racemase